MTDYSRFTGAQIQQHCRNNERTLRIATQQWSLTRQQSFDRAMKYGNQVDAAEREFQNWRIRFLAPYREGYAHLDHEADRAEADAERSMRALLDTWMVFKSVNGPDAHEAMLKQLESVPFKT